MTDSPNFIEKNRIKATNILNDTVNYLVKKFGQTVDAFTYSTAYGQLFFVVNNLYQLVLYYIQDSAVETNFINARRTTSVHGLSRLVGHNPLRGSSARGEIILRKKLTSNSTLSGNFVIIPNFSRIRCKNNNLNYVLDLGADEITVDYNQNQKQNMRIMEGVIESQTFTGTGENLQSFNVVLQPQKFIDDKFLIVTVNDEICEVFDSLQDIEFGKIGCVVKTGIGSGIDLYFGNSDVHGVPPLGSIITVNYIITQGVLGNLIDPSSIFFEFIDSGFDLNGEEANLGDLFDVVCEISPILGTEAETKEQTRLLAPNLSKSHIIHDEKSIAYYFNKLNLFSNVKIFKRLLDNMNMYNVLVIPKIKDRLLSGEDYFSMDENKIFITENERTKLLEGLEESNRQSANIDIDIIDPSSKKFACFIKGVVFDRLNGKPITREMVIRDLRQTLSDYMLENKRINFIPHSDIVRIIDNIKYWDSVKVTFIPEDNSMIDDLGNIKLSDNEIAILRGNFSDQESFYYHDDFVPDNGDMGCVNIDIKFETKF